MLETVLTGYVTETTTLMDLHKSLTKKKKKKLVILYVNILTMVTTLLTNNCIR